jgi:hypothetical protein
MKTSRWPGHIVLLTVLTLPGCDNEPSAEACRAAESRCRCVSTDDECQYQVPDQKGNCPDDYVRVIDWEIPRGCVVEL